MSRSLVQNASFSVASQLVIMIIGFLFIPVYIYFLGIEGYGIYSFIILIFGWITILQAGMDPAVIRLSSVYHADKRLIDINRLVTASLIFQFIIGSIIGSAFLFFSSEIASFVVKNELSFLDEVSTALFYAALNIITLMCKNIYISLFKGMQRYDIPSVYESAFNLIASLISVLMLWLGYGLVGMILSRLMLNLISLVILHLYVKKILPTFRFDFHINTSLLKEIYDYASWVVVSRFNRLTVNALPPVLIGMYVGPAGIAYYSIASKTALVFNNLLASSINVMFPYVSELKTINKTDEVASLYLRANKLLSVFSTPVYCFFFIYSWEFLYVWLGEDVADNCSTLMMLLFIGYYFTSSSMIPWTFSLGMGNSKILAYTGLVQTIIVISTLPYLLDVFGVNGAGLNLILFELVSIATGIIITVKLVKASAFNFWVSDRINILLLGLVCFGVVSYIESLFLTAEYSRLETFIHLSISFAVAIIVYAYIAFSYNLVEDEMKLRLMNTYKKFVKF